MRSYRHEDNLKKATNCKLLRPPKLPTANYRDPPNKQIWARQERLWEKLQGMLNDQHSVSLVFGLVSVCMLWNFKVQGSPGVSVLDAKVDLQEERLCDSSSTNTAAR